MVSVGGLHYNVKVSDGSQPPLTFGLSLSESAGSRSLHRLLDLPACESKQGAQRGVCKVKGDPFSYVGAKPAGARRG